MSKEAAIQAQARERLGTDAAVAIRKEGLIPAVVYGQRGPVRHISIPADVFTKMFRSGQKVFHLDLDGTSQNAVLKEVQVDAVSSAVLHVDFARILLTDRITVSVPIDVRGEAEGLEEGVMVEQQMREINLECLASNIPDRISVKAQDIAEAEIFKANQLALPEGAELADDPGAIVALLTRQAEEVAEAVIEAGQPEVVGAEAPAEEDGEEKDK